MYVDAIKRFNEIVVWLRDQDGDLERYEFEAPYYCYAPSPNGTIRSIYGDKVEKVEFDSGEQYRNYTDRHSILFESDISPLHKFLSDNFHNAEPTPVHVGLFDIEVDYDLNLGMGYPNDQNPYGAVNSISLFKRNTQTYHMLCLHDGELEPFDESELDGLPLVVETFADEVNLLNRFIDLIEDIDILSAWNGDGYDIKYLISRAMQVYGNKAGQCFMSRDGFTANKKEFVNDFGYDEYKYELVGRVHLDAMELYKKFTLKAMPSHKLDTIAEFELKKKKLEYKGDLGDLYRSDPQTFFQYSLHDAVLIKLLDDKKKFIDLAVGMARQATVRFTEIFGSIRYLEHSIRNYAHFERDEPLVLPDRKDENRNEKFDGAFVLNCNVGVYGYTQSIDLASLYPSVIRALNISPETHLLQCVGGHPDFVAVSERRKGYIVVAKDVQTNKLMSFDSAELHDLLREENMTISANGSVFNNNFIGLLPEVLSIWYEDRKRTKAKAAECKKAGDDAGYKYWDMIQNLKKVGLNSLYGAVSNPFSRFYTLDCALSVTLTGREIVLYQSKKADEYIKEKARAAYPSGHRNE